MANKAENSGETSLCANNCGFFGNPSTNNLCSKCYKDYLKNQTKELNDHLSLSSSSSSSPCNKLGDKSEEQKMEEKVVEVGDSSSNKNVETRATNRCSLCKKRVGLTGFRCRCEQTFCSVHRYSDKHNCAFDYKGSAQDAIARANPVVKAEKVEKI